MDANARMPDPQELGHICRVLGGWQDDDGPLHLHPGDLGWYSLRGSAATAAATRVWSENGTIVAIALLDGPDLLRFAIDPARSQDASLASRISSDVGNAEAGVLKPGNATIEARGATALAEELASHGWVPDEPWTPLRRDLAEPVSVGVSGLRVETVEPERTAEWVAVHWSAFRGTPMPRERLRSFVDGWCAAAETPFFEAGRILLLRDEHDRPVAVSTVWSGGAGSPGLIEPLGVHQEHRGRGYGAVMSRAAAAALREMGSSSATVCAESSNVGAIAT
ncbi:GNAT family N-acetyltransferase [Microbacterium invictum]|uniref:GNAT family N-acetyltransferase n=1 Tax=Microbacterium invictum TaxID=515415 RepID=A0ABZ0VCL2_9MICO|nr:GNAT family N-acetyltransferase [Microbacterium invictum]WQB70532.1 GNAT family N-acetyltransferase [Microbacterium invictum]